MLPLSDSWAQRLLAAEASVREGASQELAGLTQKPDGLRELLQTIAADVSHPSWLRATAALWIGYDEISSGCIDALDAELMQPTQALEHFAVLRLIGDLGDRALSLIPSLVHACTRGR